MILESDLGETSPARGAVGGRVATAPPRPGRVSADRLPRDLHATLLEDPAHLIQGRAGAVLDVANGNTEPGGGIVSGHVPVEGTDDHLPVLAPERGQGGRHLADVWFVIGRW